MRVIAGKAKGRVLTAPKGMGTRPITAQIKEALFNIWQTRIVDARFLDLFAGSGSIGIEAISRGAKNTVFVEQNHKAIKIIQKNLAACSFSDGYKVYQGDVFKVVPLLKKSEGVFDIIYLDPPFTAAEIFLPIMEVLSKAAILAPDGVIAIRTPRETELPDRIVTLQKTRLKQYGISSVHFFASAEVTNGGQ